MGYEMNVIEIKKLTKRFKAKKKAPGLLGSISSLFSPRYSTVTAVDDISFDVKKGEILAFLGPNGAGKSTTLKMLTGILHPNSGSISVLGMNPQKDRRKLAFHIGTVFGQKPQLWYHLPAIDTFSLFSKIYEIPKHEYQKTLKRMVDLFDIVDFYNVPVRKLSLGQRMRCEIVASLLHKPKVLFLDEPTIGLDITSKKRIRQLIKQLNKEEDMTIILTSHDMQDVESICKRMIIINEGKMIYNGALSSAREHYMNHKILDVLFAEAIPEISIPYVTVLKKGKMNYAYKLQVDTVKMDIKTMIKKLSNYAIEDITISDPPIEEIIENIYLNTSLEINDKDKR
jgi:ABC-2 type transport system ATP-binding protein